MLNIINEFLDGKVVDTEYFMVNDVISVLRQSSDFVYRYRQNMIRKPFTLIEKEQLNFKLYKAIIKPYLDKDVVYLDVRGNYTISKENIYNELMLIYLGITKRLSPPPSINVIKEIGKDAFDYIIFNSFTSAMMVGSLTAGGESKIIWSLKNHMLQAMITSCEEWLANVEHSGNKHLNFVSNNPYYEDFTKLFTEYSFTRKNYLLNFFKLGDIFKNLYSAYEKAEFGSPVDICSKIITVPFIDELLGILKDPVENEAIVSSLFKDVTDNKRLEVLGSYIVPSTPKFEKMTSLLSFFCSVNNVLTNEDLCRELPVFEDVANLIKENLIKHISLYVNEEVKIMNPTANFVTKRVLKSVAKDVYNSEYYYLNKLIRVINELNEKANYDKRLKNDIEKIKTNFII